MIKTLRTVALGIFALGLWCDHGRAEILAVPTGFGKVRAFPNPWRSDLDGSQPLTIDGLPASVTTTVRIFTLTGELVRTLGGVQSVQWDLRNNAGSRVASGVYFYLATANSEQHTGKIAVVR